VSWASDELCRVVFGDLAQDQPLTASGIEGVTERLVLFVMEHPELGRVWLFQLLGAPHPTGDKFWRLYISKLEKFAKSELAQPGLDVEAHAVLMLAATVLWTLRAHAQTHSVEERRHMAQRFAREILRLSLGGSRQLETLCYSLLRGAEPPPAGHHQALPNRSAGSN
jgi:hypothetical protein